MERFDHLKTAIAISFNHFNLAHQCLFFFVFAMLFLFSTQFVGSSHCLPFNRIHQRDTAA